MICRAGGLTKADIGAIRIFDNETKFEVAAAAAAQFASDIRRRSPENIRIEPLEESMADTGPRQRVDPPPGGERPRKPTKKERLAGNMAGRPSSPHQGKRAKGGRDGRDPR